MVSAETKRYLEFLLRTKRIKAQQKKKKGTAPKELALPAVSSDVHADAQARAMVPVRLSDKLKMSPFMHGRDSDVAALLIGIEYVRYDRLGRADRLPGCHNDMMTAQRLLMDKFGVMRQNMTILMDDGHHIVPTKAAILQALDWLKASGKKHLWLFYSGHGTSVADTNGDEADGQDEALVPEDYMESQFLEDDRLGNFIASLPAGVSLTCVFDCCHSGSILDLPFYYWSKDNAAAVNSAGSSNSAGIAAKVVSISACADNQTSLSAYNLDKKRNWQGALMYTFDKVVRSMQVPANGKVLIQNIAADLAARNYDQITVLSTPDGDVTHLPVFPAWGSI